MKLETNGKKYKTIYADPPWDIGSINIDKWKSQLQDKYETMQLEEIKNMPVKEIADDDCSLFLWTTHTFLKKAFEVIDSWGFKYHCCITWDKGGGWCACGFHRRTELCLFAYKGKLNINQEGTFIPTIINEKKTIHSKKPDKMYYWIEHNAPEPRIELFTRNQRDGWDTYGNQLSQTIQKKIT